MNRLWKFTVPVIWAASIALVVMILTVGTLKERIDGTEINEESFLRTIKPTNLLDTNDQPMAKFFGERRSISTFEEIPEEVVDALVSIEDREFWEHPGINVKAITRAVVEIARADGDLVQGGSTLTQQLVKMTLLTTEKTLERKQQEAVLATILEKNYSKEDIAEMYLNEMFYGNKAYGIKDAVRTYFGQSFDEFKADEEDVRLAKAAMLAGLLQAPSSYSPYNSFVYSEEKAKKTIERRNTVLWAMKDNGIISSEQYDRVHKLPLMILDEANFVFEEERFEERELVHYTLYEAAEILNMSMNEVMESGYDIHTSLNPAVYDIIREEFEKDSYFPRDGKDGTKVEGSAVYLNPQNGEIIAFTGGREELTNFQGFNRAFMAKRQPGSILKPIVSYGPALESGKFGQFSQLLDKAGHSFNGYTPKNWDGGGRGWVSMQEALRMSWNIPAVWTLQQVGIDYSVGFVQKLGIDFSKEKSGLSMALGGVEEGVTPFQMADAYQAYANEGVRTPAHAIRKIVNKEGTVIYEAKIEDTPIMKVETANTMKSMLQNIVENGTATRAAIPGRKIAGKTGTVQYPSVPGANRDIWFAGFDEEVLGTIWMGHDNTSKQRYLVEGSSLPTTMFKGITSRVLDYYKENGGLAAPKDLLKDPPDKVAPVISLNGLQTVSLYVGGEYVEAGATAEDDKDGDLTDAISIEGNVDTSKVGNYSVRYSVSDKTGNSTNVTRTIMVSLEPVIEEPEEIEDEVEENAEVIQEENEEESEEENTTSEEPSDVAAEDSPISSSVTSFGASYQSYSNVIAVTWGEFQHSQPVKYQVFKNGTKVGTMQGLTYSDASIQADSDYSYYVVVVDSSTNQVLSQSKSVSVKTPVEKTD